MATNNTVPYKLDSPIQVNSTTISTSIGNGSGIFLGGMSIAKNMYLGSSHSGTVDTSNAVTLSLPSYTFTDSGTAASGTLSVFRGVSFGQLTLAATNTSITTTTAASVFIQGPVIAGTNETITNNYTLLLGSGNLGMSGSSSGIVSLTVPNSFTSYNFNLPSTVGTAGQVLTTQGNSNPMTWSTVGTGSVTSVAITVPSIFSLSGSPITTSGTLAISYSGTALPVANGGTGATAATGTGNVVLATSPTLVTPTLGVASATSLTLSSPLSAASGGTGKIDITQFGADPTGTTDSTTAIQAAFTYASSLGTGYTITAPSGTFLISGSGITVNMNGGSSFISFEGKGSSSTIFNYSGTGTCFTLSSRYTQYLHWKGFSINSTVSISTQIGFCIGTSGTPSGPTARSEFEDISITSFNYGLIGYDVLTSSFKRIQCASNTYGFTLQRNSFTNPNAIDIVSSGFVNNLTYGVNIANPTCLTFIDCDFETNGTNGNTGSSACTINNQFGVAEDGTGECSWNTCYFEGNGGYDAYLLAGNSTDGPTIYSFNSCAFNRNSNTTNAFTTNNIYLTLSSGSPSTLSVTNCGFKGFSPYVVSSSRPYINITTTGATYRFLDGMGSNYYASTTETPLITTTPTSTGSITASSYIQGQTLLSGATSTVTSSGTLTLTSSSNTNQVFTGTLTHTIVLPSATTLINGWEFYFVNQSTLLITIQNAGASTIYFLLPNSSILITLTNNSTTNGVWSNIGGNNNVTLALRIGSTGYMYNSLTTGSPVVTDLRVLNKKVRAGRGTSLNAITNWTSRASGYTGFFPAICWSPELSLFILGNNASSSAIQSSPDGINWTTRTLGTAISAWDSCWSPELSLFVVSNSASSTTAFQTSSNGTSWTTVTLSTAYSVFGVCWSPELSLFVAYCASGFLTSSNGSSWTLNAYSLASGGRIVWSPELSIFVATNGSTGFYYSSNGTTWTSVAYTTIGNSLGICWSPELYLFVATSTSGSSTTSIATSPDGINWTSRTAPNSNSISSVIWVPDISTFVAVANTNVITSFDGINWVSRATIVTSYNLTYSPDLGTILIPTNNGVATYYTSFACNSTPKNSLNTWASSTTIPGALTVSSLNTVGNVSCGSILYTYDVIGQSGSNLLIDTQTAGYYTAFGYNTPKNTGATSVLQVYNNSTDRSLLFNVVSGGSGSGSNSVQINTILYTGAIDANTAGNSVYIGYNTPKYTSQAAIFTVYNNVTDRTNLFNIVSAGTGSGSNSISLNTATAITGTLTVSSTTTLNNVTTVNGVLYGSAIDSNYAGGYIYIGYNTPKYTIANPSLLVYNNSTDRLALFSVYSGGTSSGSNSINCNTATNVFGNLTVNGAISTYNTANGVGNIFQIFAGTSGTANASNFAQLVLNIASSGGYTSGNIYYQSNTMYLQNANGQIILNPSANVTVNGSGNLFSMLNTSLTSGQVYWVLGSGYTTNNSAYINFNSIAVGSSSNSSTWAMYNGTAYITLTSSTVAMTGLTTVSASTNSNTSAPFIVNNTNTSPYFSFGVLGPNMTAGQYIFMSIGQSNSVGNAVLPTFTYQGNNSSTNTFHLGFYGDTDFMTVTNGGAITLTGATTMNGQLYAGAIDASYAGGYPYIGYHTPKNTTATPSFMVYNNSTDLNNLFSVVSAGTSSGTNVVNISCPLNMNNWYIQNVNCISPLGNGLASNQYLIFFVNNANSASIGGVYKNADTSVSYNTTSDYRLKENLEPVTSALDSLMKVKVYNYNFKADPNTVHHGYLAHELQEVFPTHVVGEKDAVEKDPETGVEKMSLQMVDYSKMAPMLTAGLQELFTKVNSSSQELNSDLSSYKIDINSKIQARNKMITAQQQTINEQQTKLDDQDTKIQSLKETIELLMERLDKVEKDLLTKL